MMSRYIKVLLLAAVMMAVLSCEEDLKPQPYTYSKLLTGEQNKTWAIKFFEETLDGKVIDNFMPSCLTDDQFKFYANTEHLYETTSGSRACFEDEPGLSTSTWTFTNSNATVFMLMPIFSDDPLPFFVRTLDDDDLEIEIFLDEGNTSSYRIHFDSIDEE